MYKGKCVGGPWNGEIIDRDDMVEIVYLIDDKLEPVDAGKYTFSEKRKTWVWNGPEPTLKH